LTVCARWAPGGSKAEALSLRLTSPRKCSVFYFATGAKPVCAARTVQRGRVVEAVRTAEAKGNDRGGRVAGGRARLASCHRGCFGPETRATIRTAADSAGAARSNRGSAGVSSGSGAASPRRSTDRLRASSRPSKALAWAKRYPPRPHSWLPDR